MHQPAGQFLGRQAAVFIEPVAALRRQALDPCLDRDAAGGAEQFEHVLAPQIDAGLHPELHRPLPDGLKQFAPRQEDFIDKIDVARAGCDQPVQFFEDGGEGAAAVAVAEVFLRAERAVIGAAARGLHLRSRQQRRRVEAVVMMRVPMDRRRRPVQCRQLRDVGGLRSALHDYLGITPVTQPGNLRPAGARRLGEKHQYLLAFAKHDDISR